ncbi:hypothetical protein [Bacillus sp. USDA818B3_A]|uniref:hypothetical protein n=1 Tax=Bacillus sp. USDA818B3_A TaxID=2698834 RepID=UPI00137189FA|nr:hypothetical protein [Bacillus sp. USDA818B3_A]
MTKKAREPSNMEEAGMKTDDALYKNEQMGNDKDLQQKDGNRQANWMDAQNSQQGNREHQEQFRQNGQSGGARSSEDEQEPEHQFYGYNIVRDDDQDGRLTNNFEEKNKNRDPNPEKQVDEYFQRYNQDDPLEKHT